MPDSSDDRNDSAKSSDYSKIGYGAMGPVTVDTSTHEETTNNVHNVQVHNTTGTQTHHLLIWSFASLVVVSALIVTLVWALRTAPDASRSPTPIASPSAPQEPSTPTPDTVPPVLKPSERSPSPASEKEPEPNRDPILARDSQDNPIVPDVTPKPPPALQFVPATPEDLRNATSTSPYINSLGMKFVPVYGTDVLFCIWETRRQDMEQFRREEPLLAGDEWQTYASVDDLSAYEPDSVASHPVTHIPRRRIDAFLNWLSQGEGATYRLPTDWEWSQAAMLSHERGVPAAVHQQEHGRNPVYPWGDWPPESRVSDSQPMPGNYGDRSLTRFGPELGWSAPPGGESITRYYNDGWPTTSPAGMGQANPFGLHDLGGNVWEICIEDGSQTPVLRGASWRQHIRQTLSSAYRKHSADPGDDVGFRCVIELP